MELGTGIFLSTLLVCLFLFYRLTKDKWNWKKIVVRVILGLVLAVAITAGGVYAYKEYEFRPRIYTEFDGIKISHTRSDIRFIKGAPAAEDEDSMAYKDSSGLTHFITFKDEKVRTIMYIGESYYGHRLSEIGMGNSYKNVVDKFGAPSLITNTQDDLERWLSYSNYNVFFVLKKNQVVRLGIFNSQYGDVGFKDKTSDESS